MKKPSYVIPILVSLSMMIFLPPNISFSQENANQEFSENVKIETSSRTGENGKDPRDKTPFGLKIAHFMKTSLDLFEEQREVTIQTIKECREDLKNTDKSEWEEIRKECRERLDVIREEYSEIRETYQSLFVDFRDIGLKTLKEEIREKGKEVQNSKAVENLNKAADKNQKLKEKFQEKIQKHLKKK